MTMMTAIADDRDDGPLSEANAELLAIAERYKGRYCAASGADCRAGAGIPNS